MQAREIGDDCRLAAAAFANDRAAGGLGGCAVAIEALLDTSNCSGEQRIFHQYPFRAVHHCIHASSVADASLPEPAAMADGCGRSRFASNTGRMSSSLKKSDRAVLGAPARIDCCSSAAVSVLGFSGASPGDEFGAGSDKKRA